LKFYANVGLGVKAVVFVRVLFFCTSDNLIHWKPWPSQYNTSAGWFASSSAWQWFYWQYICRLQYAG